MFNRRNPADVALSGIVGLALTVVAPSGVAAANAPTTAAPQSTVERSYAGYAPETAEPALPGHDAAAPGTCGVTVDRPHFSHSAWNQRRAYEIHTRVHSDCVRAPYKLLSISGTTQRGHWWGWEDVGGVKPSLPSRKNDYVVAVAACEPNSSYQYKTIGTGNAIVNGKHVTRSAYEQNDNPIKCAPR